MACQSVNLALGTGVGEATCSFPFRCEPIDKQTGMSLEISEKLPAEKMGTFLCSSCFQKLE